MNTVANKPPWVPPRIKAAPKIRQIYWCDYWKDARLPEMWKTRPVIVVSYKNTLTGPCLVVPVSTEPQDNNRVGTPAFDRDRGGWRHLMGGLQPSDDVVPEPVQAIQGYPALAQGRFQPSA